MSVSLYRKYRPQNFSSVVGQTPALHVLTHSIKNSRVGHAYLFSGSRGCGKTSVARIFAKALNCLDPQGVEPCGNCKNCTDITAGESLDVIEIDGASNNGVENIRGLKENVTLAPFSSKYKVYIIDEVHMLSQGAFNALLKTLEEPPEHVIFIMATTEPHKVPVTIRSRCQHIPFHSISTEDIFSRLEEICRLENISAESEALWEISRQADGALRDALSLLEQVIAAGDVTLANVESVFGAGSRPAFERWIVKLRSDVGEAYSALKAMFDAGASGVRIFEEMFSLVRNLWLVSKWPGMAQSIGASSQEKNFLQDEAKHWKPDKLHALLNSVNKILTLARSGMRNDILLGMWLLYMEGTPKEEAASFPAQASNSAPVQEQKSELDFAFSSEQKAMPIFAPEPKPTQTFAPVQEDLNLKQDLLRTAHEKNFTIFTALFDARTSANDGTLILDFQHVYCYEVLKVDRTAAKISGMFENFSKIILRYRSSEYTCPKITLDNLFELEQDTPQPVRSKRKSENEISFAHDASQEKPRQPVTSRETQDVSIFRQIKQELIRYGLKPEIILSKQADATGEPDENSGFTLDETDTDTDNE